MIKSILLAVDGSPYTEAVLQTGIWFAKQFHAGLRVVTIVDVRYFDWVVNSGADSYMPVIPSDLYRDESQKYLEQRAQAVMETSNKKLNAAGVRFSTERLNGAPVNQICELSLQFDLAIMGERGDFAAWSDAMLGNTLEPVTRQIKSPLLITGKTFEPVTSVLCAYDGSENSSRALKFSAYISNELHLPLDILTVNNNENERRANIEAAKQYINNFEIRANYRHEAGEADEIIIESLYQADTGTILVMGSHGHSRIREAILGCTTVQVMRGASKPILLVR